MLLGCAAALVGGCQKEAKVLPVVIEARPTTPAPDASAPKLVFTSPPKTGTEPTIELSGIVQAGAGRPRFPVSVLVTSGDCTNPASRLIRRVPVSDNGGFYLVVMADPGEKLWVCAASEPAPGALTPVWAQSAPIVVGPQSDQAVGDLVLSLIAAEPKQFATSPQKSP